MKRFLIYMLFASLLAFNLATAQLVDEQGISMKKTGQSTMNFLQVSVVPKAIALGDAFTATGVGVESMFYNPAGLSEIKSNYEVFMSMTQWIADINYIAGAAAWNMGNAGVLGLNFVTVDYGEIIGTRLVLIENAGTDQLGYEETGEVSNVGAFAFGLAYSRSITDKFMIGGSMRYAGQQLGQSILSRTGTDAKDNNQSKLVFDLGVKYYTPIKSFCFGMSIRNFSNAVKYEEITTQLPMTFAVGGAMDLMDFIMSEDSETSSLLATVEFTHPNNYTERIHMGLEYSFKDFLALRGGYITNHDVAGLSLGFGLFPKLMGTTAELSYTYSSMELFDDVNRFSLRFAF